MSKTLREQMDELYPPHRELQGERGISMITGQLLLRDVAEHRLIYQLSMEPVRTQLIERQFWQLVQELVDKS